MTKTLEEIDGMLVDTIWALLDYPDLKHIGGKLHVVEKELDAIINGVAKISEVEVRFSA
jgi:hypothetical protein